LIALDATFNSFTDACTWPDRPRKRAEEHFINVGRSAHTIAVAQCPAVPKCLFTAIPADLDVLRTSNDDAATLASLKFLGHWIGDIHQPLHVSFADDRGGNSIRESGPCCGIAPEESPEGRCLRMGVYVSARKATAGAHVAGAC